MATQAIYAEKALAVTDTPLLIFDCTLVDGTAEHWSTHAVTVNGTAYAARVLQQNVFEMQMASSQGVDGIPGISVVLANADSHFSEIEQATGWKGALLTVSFLFYDLRNDVPATDTQVVFQGICNPPDESREATFRHYGEQPDEPAAAAAAGGADPAPVPVELSGDSRTADGSRRRRGGRAVLDVLPVRILGGETGGSGNLNSGAPYTTCGYVRADCQARGMWLNFGGIEFVPPAIAVRTSGDKNYHTSAISVNEALYNDFVPMVYGTAWYAPPVVFARNDGNLTRMEVLLGIGADARRADGAGERRPDPAGRGRDEHDGHGMVQHSDAGDARRQRATRTSRIRPGSRRAIRTAAWRTWRWWCRTGSTTARRCRP